MIGTRCLIGLMLASVCAGSVQAAFFSPHKKDCIPLHSIRTETAETESSLIFHTNDGRAYRNALPAPCDGLLGINELGELGMEGKDDQLCAGDLVWLKQKGLFSSLGLGSEGSDAGCKLGSFEPISEMSLTEFLRR